MLKLLIFDLDGTLVDTITDITHAINHAVAPFGVKPISIETARSMVGSGISKLIKELIDSGNRMQKITAQDTSREATERFMEYYSKHLLDNTNPTLR